jgi:hypothetical protein
LRAKAQQFFAQHSSQHSDPAFQSHFGDRQMDEEMDVIGHDDIAANCDIVFGRGARGKCAKGVVYLRSGQERKTFVSVERDEIKGLEEGKEAFQTWRALGEVGFIVDGAESVR